MNRHNGLDRATSDAWLGPRLHATLRLSRREAGNRGVWRFLGLWGADYVRWRFGPADATDVDHAAGTERFDGPDTKQAFARLWWMCELFRNGSDYTPAALALTNQDIVNNLFRMRVTHHRPTALAAVYVLPRSADGAVVLSGRSANALAKATNAAASTLLLDVIAHDPPPDLTSRTQWESQGKEYDPRTDFETMPDGPDDGEVPTSDVDKMTVLLSELLAEAPVRGQRKMSRPRRGETNYR